MYTLVQPQDSDPLAAAAACRAMTDLLLGQFSQGVFMLDADDRVTAPLSPSLHALFRRQDLAGLGFREMLQPIVPRKFLAIALAHLARVRTAAVQPQAGPCAPLDVEARFANGNGANDLLHYVFDFTPLHAGDERGKVLVRVTDQTTTTLQAREIGDLHQQLRTQSDILQTLLRIGTARFAVVTRTTDTLLGAINEILRRPAREPAAFRTKLEQTLSAADRIGRSLAATSLRSLMNAAQQFESALVELRDRPVLSGNDFLPLAVKLDELLVQFSQIQTLTRSLDTGLAADSPPEPGALSQPQPSALNQTAPPNFVVELLERNGGTFTAGTLAHTLGRLTENVAAEEQREVALECVGLELLPPAYLATVKNIVIQFIRNAVVHGIEPAHERSAQRKPLVGRLQLQFRQLADASFELTFEDDGRGLDPESVREIAIARGMIEPGAARTLRDRQVLKLIFKSRYTTLPGVAGGKKHGTGLAFVRRYVHDAGGVVSLGSEPGRSTRFRVCLPALAPAADGVAAAAST